MKRRSPKVGRLKLPFATIEKIAAEQLADDKFAQAFGVDWKISRQSALYRRKDGTFTLSLIWTAGKDRLTSRHHIRTKQVPA